MTLGLLSIYTILYQLVDMNSGIFLWMKLKSESWMVDQVFEKQAHCVGDNTATFNFQVGQNLAATISHTMYRLVRHFVKIKAFPPCTSFNCKTKNVFIHCTSLSLEWFRTFYGSDCVSLMTSKLPAIITKNQLHGLTYIIVKMGIASILSVSNMK